MYFSMPSWYLNNRIHCLTFSFVTSIFYNKYCTREDILVHVYILSETSPPSFSVCPWKNQQSTPWLSSYPKTWIIMSQIHHRTVLSFKVYSFSKPSQRTIYTRFYNHLNLQTSIKLSLIIIFNKRKSINKYFVKVLPLLKRRGNLYLHNVRTSTLGYK